MKKALVVGATGLVGKQLTQKLLASNFYDLVTVLVRRPFDIQHPKLEVLVMNFDTLEKDKIVADDVFCCLGSTMKQAGSKENFYKVDFMYPLEIAKAAKENGTNQFLVISSMGANIKGLFFYSQVKGKMEKALSDLNFPHLLIFRPSLLLGKRLSEKRLGESVGAFFMKLFQCIIPKKYQAIDSAKVAQAMMETAQKNYLSKIVFESTALQNFSK